MTQQQIDFIVNNYGKMKRSDILRNAVINEKQYYTILKENGIKTSHKWTEEEKQFITENYKKMSKREIALALGKCFEGVKKMGVKLGLADKKLQIQGSPEAKKTLCWTCSKSTDFRKCTHADNNNPRLPDGCKYEPGILGGWMVIKCPNYERG